MQLSFSEAVADDVNELVALRIAAMRDSLEKTGRYDPVRVRERFVATFDPADTRHVVANGQRVGVIVVRKNTDYWLLNHLYLLPSHQGKGIGTWVLRHLFAEADACRASIKVGALRDSDANRFYVQAGFCFTHEEAFDLYYLRTPR